MIETTMQDREKELRSLLDQINAHPERDWSDAKQRVEVLKIMIAGMGGAG